MSDELKFKISSELGSVERAQEIRIDNAHSHMWRVLDLWVGAHGKDWKAKLLEIASDYEGKNDIQ